MVRPTSCGGCEPKTALTWAAEDRDAETLLRLCGGLWQFWQTRGELTVGRRWLEAGLSIRPSASDPTIMTALWGARLAGISPSRRDRR